MKYLSDLLRISIFVIIMYLPLAWLSTQKSLQTIYQIRNEEQVKNFIKVKDAVDELLKEDRILEACQRLKAEVAAQNIIAYNLVSKEGSCHELLDNFLPVKCLDLVESFELKGNVLNYIREKTRDTDWAISTSSPEKINFLAEMKSNKSLREALFMDLFLVIYIIFAFVFFAVLILAKSIQNQYRKNGQDPLWLKIVNTTFGHIQLHDLKIVKAATNILIKTNESLIKDIDLLETSLEFSILNEIRENKSKTPYTFFGTVAKVDINGFSKVISNNNSASTQNLTKILEDFGCELLLRYRGLFEKTVGDEIVVVFKSHQSAILATAFSRDLMREFSKIEFEFNSEKRKFTLKSSICSSELIFSKRAPGFGFLGDALTYTTRLLDVVNIKDRNILSCMKNQGAEIKELVNLPSESKLFEFKNMQASEGYLIDQFVTIEEVYTSQMHLLGFFRSDEALLFLLNKIKTETDPTKIDSIFKCFAQIQIRVCHIDYISNWIECLKIYEKRATSDKKWEVLFSQLITEGSRLIPTPQWSQGCTDALVSISRNIEGRINASVVDVLIDKDLNRIILENEKTFLIGVDESYRTQGNLLINQALYKLSNDILSSVIKMINSNNILESKTGVYCACRIILHYKKVNPVELETFAKYKKLFKILSHLNVEKDIQNSARLLTLLKKINHEANL